MGATSQNPLGKTSHYPEKYRPDLLFKIKRKESNRPYQNHGIDRWTCYELSWLNAQSQPESKIGVLEIPESSPYIVESKSVKLYLNSLNFTPFESEESLANTLKKDISTCIEAPVHCKILSISDLLNTPTLSKNSRCLDTKIHEKNTKKNVKESLYSHHFRSRCPVTQQPDWASIEIAYEGHKIPESELYTLITNDRQKEGFHETCIEALFDTILKQYECQNLTVYGYFTRRGGIDITPIRSTHTNYPKDKRIPRQ